MSLSTLYLLKFNNYYNRIVKRYDTIDDYSPYLLGTLSDINFVPLNGISTTQIVNWNNAIPDYILVQDNRVGDFSRWFVIESSRTRQGQFKLTLRRDVLAENIDLVLNAPTFVEKGWVLNNDPAIYNPEDIQVNQILHSQTPVTDGLKWSWLIGYCARHEDGQSWDTNEVSYASSMDGGESYSTQDSWIESFFGTGQTNPQGFLNGVLYVDGQRGNYEATVTLNLTESTCRNVGYDLNSLNTYIDRDIVDFNDDGSQSATLISGFKLQDGLINNSKLEEFANIYNGKNITINGIIYAPEITVVETAVSKRYYERGENISIYTTQAIANQYYDGNVSEVEIHGSGRYVAAKYTKTSLNIRLGNPISTGDVVFTALSSNRKHLSNAPYDMFAVPLRSYTGFYDYAKILMNSRMEGAIDEDKILGVINALAAQAGESIYDLQILPYCPFYNKSYVHPYTNGTQSNGYIDANSLQEGYDYSTIYTKNGDTKVIKTLIFYCDSDSVEFSTNYSIPWDGTKESIICDKYRLVSPNFNGATEINPYFNGLEGITSFRISMSCLPFNPWIRVRPNYTYLNGLSEREHNDRGLVLSGNFSISRISDTWANYQLNNINYQNIFDRQIKNTEYNNKYSRIQEQFGAVAGMAQGIAAGGLLGGIPGAAIGAAASIPTGIADLTINEKLRQEQLRYTKDMYGYNIQNIQAQPDTLAKITAFNVESMIFPFVQYYTCTDVEKEAVRNKLIYNGMTIGRIDNLKNFIYTDDIRYVKGQIIRLEGLDDDFNIAAEIASEVSQGFFIKEGDY